MASDPFPEMTFVPWKEIRQFHNVIKDIESAKEFIEGMKMRPTSSPQGAAQDLEKESTVTNQSVQDEFTKDNEDEGPGSSAKIVEAASTPIVFKGKVKLHGSNAGIAFESGKMRAQSRNQFIEKSGFGRILYSNWEYWLSVAGAMKISKLTIYGEYCGPGVQSGVALARIPHHIFAVFAIDIGDELIIEPEDLENILTQNQTVEKPLGVFVLPWHPGDYTIDLIAANGDGKEKAQQILDQIDEEVTKIDQLDPWVQKLFGIDGPGEGLVLYPISICRSSKCKDIEAQILDRSLFGSFAFKAKGEKHRVVSSKKSTTVAPEKATDALNFANIMCPEPRMEQGAQTVGGFDMAKIKAFVQWVIDDVKKEGQNELAASNLEWKDVTSLISKKASTWFVQKAKGQKTSASNAIDKPQEE